MPDETKPALSRKKYEERFLYDADVDVWAIGCRDLI